MRRSDAGADEESPGGSLCTWHLFRRFRRSSLCHPAWLEMCIRDRAYILAVNPSVLGATGMDQGAIFTATVLAAVIGTVCMALFANYPFALAPGMGLNAYFAYTVVIGMGYPWQAALAAVFVEGVIFILLSLFNIREAIFNSIPTNLKKAVSVGIGFFIAFIGLQNAKIVVGGATLVEFFSLDAVEGGTTVSYTHLRFHRISYPL